ncbi:MAG: ABC transporter permease [Firmicutes bacterium]|nr:ABC transporter permease [Bacillota bacterium]
MGTLVIKRLFQTVLVMLGLSLIVFLVLQATADIAAILMPGDATTEEIEALRHTLGLDRPLYVQYFSWLGGVVKGDFGNSYRYNLPALPLVLKRMPATLQLGVTAQLIALLVAFPLGILAAVYRGSIVDRFAMGLAMLGQSVAHFWLGLMLIFVLGLRFDLLPISGTGSWLHLIMPAVTLSTRPMARTARLVRSGMLEILGQDYIRTARAKGLAEMAVVRKHALKNAMIPIVTVIGLELGSLLNGSVVVENVFAWPGVGQLLVQSLKGRDLPVVQASVLLIAGIYVFINLVVDILYKYLDPRVRFH